MAKQSDIARRFDLPERQSKLATMLREEGLKDEQVYCICRSSDVSRFMIGCDRCEEWYHGDCINVTESEANKIRKFYCKRCRDKHPGLVIKYKQKRTHNHHHHSSGSSSSKHHRDKDKRPEKSQHKHEKHSVVHGKPEKKKERCGECEACYLKEDCGRCEQCKDMSKFGGSDKYKQRCKKRQCHNFYHLAKKHSSKPSSSSHDKNSRNDHSYNTVSAECSSSKPSKSSIHITSFAEFATISTTPADKPPQPPPEKPEAARKVPSAPPNKVRSSSPPRLKTQEDSSPHLSIAKPQPQVRPQLVARAQPQPAAAPAGESAGSGQQETKPTKPVAILRDRNNSDDEVWQPRIPKPRKQRKDFGVPKKRKPKRVSSSDSDDARSFESHSPRQCFGPGCVKAARPSSKYCSDECGLRLAETRIYSVLPQRIQEWKMSVCTSEEKDRKELEKIRHQQLEARKSLQLLDEKHKELDAIIDRGKSAQIDPRADEEGEEEASEGALVYCVTCGHEIPSRRAIKHMHNCYNKLESQMSFGSMYKTRIEGNNMFCDFFNTSTRTYCKRLRVMCPEHTKEPKVSNTEVCGFPLTSNLFTENGKVCRVSKKKCLKHYCWDKLRKASIDMERVRQCLKLDELVEQERQVRLSITNRAGVLGLMLHSTYDHQMAVKFKKPQVQSDHQYHTNQQEEEQPKDLNDSFASDSSTGVRPAKQSPKNPSVETSPQKKPRDDHQNFKQGPAKSNHKASRSKEQPSQKDTSKSGEQSYYKKERSKDKQPYNKDRDRQNSYKDPRGRSEQNARDEAGQAYYVGQGEQAYYKNDKHFDDQQYFKSDHHYHRQNPKNRLQKNHHHHNQNAQQHRYNNQKFYQSSQQKYHDHQYFSSAQTLSSNKRTHDHLYYSDRK